MNCSIKISTSAIQAVHRFPKLQGTPLGRIVVNIERDGKTPATHDFLIIQTTDGEVIAEYGDFTYIPDRSKGIDREILTIARTTCERVTGTGFPTQINRYFLEDISLSA